MFFAAPGDTRDDLLGRPLPEPEEVNQCAGKVLKKLPQNQVTVGIGEVGKTQRQVALRDAASTHRETINQPTNPTTEPSLHRNGQSTQKASEQNAEARGEGLYDPCHR
jgi:hypothetical protein